MQHRLTAELDKVAFAAYKAELADLAIDGFPTAPPRRGTSAGPGSRRSVGCAAFTNGEFAEVAATYFGVKSPCMIPHVARRIQNTSSVVDAFGHVFFTDVRILNRKSVRTAWHDSVATVIEGSLREARVSYDREVPASSRTWAPADAATSFFEQHAGKGPG
ncbi:hypothetical protein JL721_10563 [Aureococcus anophagefferens]|nr:hypothetical protein JL721_10563 [Aureococcus anophagefferens]